MNTEEELANIQYLDYQVWLLRFMVSINGLSDVPDPARAGVMSVMFVGRTMLMVFEDRELDHMLHFSGLCDFFFLTPG
jgi:hypothetical protein